MPLFLDRANHLNQIRLKWQSITFKNIKIYHFRNINLKINYNFFIQSFGIAINRSATQITSIVVTAILGFISTEILAEFSLALSFTSIFFVMITTIQMGVQAEFGRLYSKRKIKALLESFYSVTIIVLILSCFLIILAWFIPNPFIKAKV